MRRDLANTPAPSTRPHLLSLENFPSCQWCAAFSRLKTRWPTTFFDKAAKQLIQQPSDQHGLKYIFELHLSAKERLKKACFSQKSGQKYGAGPSWSMPN